MSLQSTYQSRKALLVDNLETMGVTGYDENDGLTTLINAVLEIGPTPGFDGIDLSSDKDILSAYDSESATLTAQLLSGSSPALVAGETVSFEVRKTSDDSLVETLTDITDSSGIATVSYLGEGVGDLYIKAVCGLSSETFSIEDCIDTDPLIADNNKFALTGSANVSYSSNGLSMVGTANATSLYLYKGTLPSNFVFECDVVSYTVGAYNWSAEICVSHTAISNGVNNGNKTRFGTFTDVNYGNTGFTYTDVSRVDAPYHLKVEIENGTATFYIDDVQKHQRSSGTTDFGLKSYNNRGVVIKNMKIKPL